MIHLTATLGAITLWKCLMFRGLGRSIVDQCCECHRCHHQQQQHQQWLRCARVVLRLEADNAAAQASTAQSARVFICSTLIVSRCHPPQCVRASVLVGMQLDSSFSSVHPPRCSICVLKCMMLLLLHLLRGASEFYFTIAVPNHENFAETASHVHNRTIHHILQVLESELLSVSRDNRFHQSSRLWLTCC